MVDKESVMYENKPIFVASNSDKLKYEVQKYKAIHPDIPLEEPYVVNVRKKLVKKDAFTNDTTIGVVLLDKNVELVEPGAFVGCTSLYAVKIDAENPIYDSREDCNAIIETKTNTLFIGSKNTVIPDSITAIGGHVFYGCTDLTSITIPDSVTKIGGAAFYGCINLTSVTIPNSVTKIGGAAFEDCTNLSSVTIPDSVTEIGDYAFCRTNLSSVTIPNSVTKIGEDAFYGCTNLTSVTIPNSVTKIGGAAFNECTNLSSVTIPDSVTEIGDYAFRRTNLSSVTIPNSVTKIGSGAFKECTNLSSIVIPDSVTKIGDSAFYGCTNLSSIVFPDSVTEIRDYAFYGCTNLSSVTIPGSVTKIGEGAFDRCTNLTSVTMPYSVRKSKRFAFNGCIKLTNITIHDNRSDEEKNAISGNLQSMKPMNAKTKKKLEQLIDQYVSLTGSKPDPMVDQKIESFEQKYGFKLPGSYKLLLKRCNGVYYSPDFLKEYDKDEWLDKEDYYYELEMLPSWLGIDSFIEVYGFIHRDEDSDISKYVIPIDGGDGLGNYNCIDLSTGEYLFWDHETDECEGSNHSDSKPNKADDKVGKEIIDVLEKSLEYINKDAAWPIAKEVKKQIEELDIALDHGIDNCKLSTDGYAIIDLQFLEDEYDEEELQQNSEMIFKQLSTTMDIRKYELESDWLTAEVKLK